MGTSRGVLLSGVALIIGLYGTGIKQADGLTAITSINRVNESQAFGIARSGLRFAINDLAQNNFQQKVSSTTVSMFGGSLYYKLDSQNFPAGTARIWSTGTFNGVKTALVADVEKVSSSGNKGKKKSGNRWQISRVYVQPS